MRPCFLVLLAVLIQSGCVSYDVVTYGHSQVETPQGHEHLIIHHADRSSRDCLELRLSGGEGVSHHQLEVREGGFEVESYTAEYPYLFPLTLPLDVVLLVLSPPVALVESALTEVGKRPLSPPRPLAPGATAPWIRWGPAVLTFPAASEGRFPVQVSTRSGEDGSSAFLVLDRQELRWRELLEWTAQNDLEPVELRLVFEETGAIFAGRLPAQVALRRWVEAVKELMFTAPRRRAVSQWRDLEPALSARENPPPGFKEALDEARAAMSELDESLPAKPKDPPKTLVQRWQALGSPRSDWFGVVHQQRGKGLEASQRLLELLEKDKVPTQTINGILCPVLGPELRPAWVPVRAGEVWVRPWRLSKRRLAKPLPVLLDLGELKDRYPCKVCSGSGTSSHVTKKVSGPSYGADGRRRRFVTYGSRTETCDGCGGAGYAME